MKFESDQRVFEEEKMVRGTPYEKSVFAKSQDAARVGKKKINKRASLVKTANSQDDPLASLPLFKVSCKILQYFWKYKNYIIWQFTPPNFKL